MRAFRAGQIESGEMPPVYQYLFPRIANKHREDCIFFPIKKEGQRNFVKKNPLPGQSDLQSFILHSVYRSFSRLIGDEKILCRYYIRHNGRFTIEGFDVHCTCTTNEKDQTFLSIDLPFVKTRSTRDK